MMRVFRWIALVEGVTTLVLFLVAMPAKYMLGWPHLVPPAGWIHGLAFIAYIVTMPIALSLCRAGAVGWLRTFAAAFVPFGTFANAAYVCRLDMSRR